MPHSIRLRGPWEYQPLARFRPLASGQLRVMHESLPAGGTLNLPGDWGDALGRDFEGIVRFTRCFHCPTGLEADSRVWLVVEDVDSHARIELNDHYLGEVASGRSSVARDQADDAHVQFCPARFDITPILRPQNRLSISVTSPSLATHDSQPVSRPGREGQPGGLIGLIRLEIE